MIGVPLHPVDLRELERVALEECTSAEHVLLGWEDRNGFVYVPGHGRVQGGDGIARVEVKREHREPCRACKDGTITLQLVLFVRFEHALDRLMFWFGRTPGLVSGACAKCSANARSL